MMSERLLDTPNIPAMPEAAYVPPELVSILAIDYDHFINAMLAIDFRLAQLDGLRPLGRSFDYHMTFVGQDTCPQSDGPVRRQVLLLDRYDKRWGTLTRVIANDEYDKVGGRALDSYDFLVGPDQLVITGEYTHFERRRMDKLWQLDSCAGPILYPTSAGIVMKSGKGYDHKPPVMRASTLRQFVDVKDMTLRLRDILDPLGVASQEPNMRPFEGKF